MSIACNTSGGDLLNLKPQDTGRVVYLVGEDPQSVITQRIHSIGQQLNPTSRESIAKNLILEPVMGQRIDIMNDQYLANLIKSYVGTRLIVLDTLSRLHRLDENSNSDMAQLVATLEHIVASTGASILYLHHVNKSSVREDRMNQQQAARGASALIDNARWCGFLAKMTENESKCLSDDIDTRQPIGNNRRNFFVRFGISKQNYCVAPIDQWYERRSGGILVPVELKNISNGKK